MAEVTYDCNSLSLKKRRKKGEGTVAAARKKLKNAGKEYISSSNKSLPAKARPAPESQCACRYKCKNLSYKHKIELFEDFYALENIEKQGSYLMGLMQISNVKRRRYGTYDEPSQSRRQATVYYTLPDGKGDLVQVCRATFAEVFSLTQKKIQVLTEKKKKGDTTYQDLRGNKIKHRKFSEEIEKQVIAHINTFPREKSHYSRRKTEKEYLSPDLNVHRMFKAFKNINSDSQVTYRFYYDTFHKHFPNLSFHRPRSDTCCTCDRLDAMIKSNPHEKQELTARLELHHRKAENAMTMMKKDQHQSQTPSSVICTASMDLQQVLFVPTLTHSQMFYLRQLAVYNFGVHIADTNDAYMTLWHEGMTGRGANEIASCLFKIFAGNGATGKKKLIIWSDNCCGQNKNRVILFLWMYLVITGVFDEINHKFLVSGHSFLSCDRDFAIIEKRKRVTKCVVPEDVKNMIHDSRQIKPFITSHMNASDFFDFKKAADSSINTAKLNISKVQWLWVDKHKPHIVKTKRCLNELEAWENVSILKKGVRAENIKKMQLQVLEVTSHISEEKKKDLTEMMQYLTNDEHKVFYKSITE